MDEEDQYNLVVSTQFFVYTLRGETFVYLFISLY